jgi:hypothetical protein
VGGAPVTRGGKNQSDTTKKKTHGGHALHGRQSREHLDERNKVQVPANQHCHAENADDRSCGQHDTLRPIKWREAHTTVRLRQLESSKAVPFRIDEQR